MLVLRRPNVAFCILFGSVLNTSLESKSDFPGFSWGKGSIADALGSFSLLNFHSLLPILTLVNPYFVYFFFLCSKTVLKQLGKQDHKLD